MPYTRGCNSRAKFWGKPHQALVRASKEQVVDLKDLLAGLQQQLNTPSSAEPSDLKALLARISSELAKPDDRSVLRDKRARKREELLEGGRREGKRDWVSQRVPEPVVADRVTPGRALQGPIAEPTLEQQRSDEQLFVLLIERWRRFIKVSAMDPEDNKRRGLPEPKPKVALANAEEVANMLEQRGYPEAQIVIALQTITQEGGEDK